MTLETRATAKQVREFYRKIAAAESERDQALRELGEARERLSAREDRLCFECEAALAGPYCPNCNPPSYEWLAKAQSDRDAALRSTAELRGALEPFAEFADVRGVIPDGAFITVGSNIARKQLTMGDCRKARTALAKET